MLWIHLLFGPQIFPYTCSYHFVCKDPLSQYVCLSIYFLVSWWIKKVFYLETSYIDGGTRKEDTYRFCNQKVIGSVARGFGPFRIWPPEVSALFHFGPGGFGPSIWKCRIFASLLDFLLFVLSLFPNNLWSKSRTTAIKQGRQLLHEPSLTFYFLFLFHSIFQFDLSQLFV